MLTYTNKWIIFALPWHFVHVFVESDRQWQHRKKSRNTEYCVPLRNISWFFLEFDCHRLTNKKSHKKIKCWCLKIYHKSAWWSHNEKQNKRTTRQVIDLSDTIYISNDQCFWQNTDSTRRNVFNDSQLCEWYGIWHSLQAAGTSAKFIVDLVMSKAKLCRNRDAIFPKTIQPLDILLC